ncbi:MAG: hypothetical protein ACOH5I_11830 [Oligoflexus sp.]
MRAKSATWPLCLLTLGLISLTLLPNLLTQGMFFDGLTYAAISRNLVDGLGPIWQTHYTDSLYPRFYEHPPLAFYLQSLAFRLLGDQFYVEKLRAAGLGILPNLRAMLAISGYQLESPQLPPHIEEWSRFSNQLFHQVKKTPVEDRKVIADSKTQTSLN